MNVKFETTVSINEDFDMHKRVALLDYLIGGMSYLEIEDWMNTSKYRLALGDASRKAFCSDT